MQGENWTKEETKTTIHKKVKDVLKEIKKKRKGKKFEMIKVCDAPLTYIEREVK